MAQSEGFKHITVTPAEEEDVVIRVGASGGGEPEEEPQVDPEPASNGHPEGDDGPARNDTPEPAPAEARPSPQKKRDDYREATLEDLKSQPMPLAQKIVIAAAFVCIIGAIVYYLLFLR